MDSALRAKDPSRGKQMDRTHKTVNRRKLQKFISLCVGRGCVRPDRGFRCEWENARFSSISPGRISERAAILFVDASSLLH